MTHLSFLAQTQSFFFLSCGASLHPRPDAPSLSTVAHLLYPRPYDPPSFIAVTHLAILVQMPPFILNRGSSYLSPSVRPLTFIAAAQVSLPTGAGLSFYWRRSPLSLAQVSPPRGAGPKKDGGPAPRIGLLRNILAQVLAKKADLRRNTARFVAGKTARAPAGHKNA